MPCNANKKKNKYDAMQWKQEKNKYDTMQYNQEKNKDDMTK